MYKVLLVTIQNNSNFGNRLQNYALQSILERMGFQVENLSLTNVKLADMTVSNLMRLQVGFRRAISIVLKKYKPGVSRLSRRIECSMFSQKYIKNYLVLSRENLKNYDFGEYVAVITGSDQVWHNWKRIHDELSYYYLDFIDQKKRVSYAPSFGFDAFPEEDKEVHKKGLLGMGALSCREIDGCRLIYQLTGKEAKNVLDPTLLLSKKDWKATEKKPGKIKGKRYLLKFFLGNTSAEQEQEIKKIASKKNLDIVDINNLNNPQYFGISPCEFIWLIHHAEIVCTDSFHATVFSIIYEKDLLVFKRNAQGFENMFGRLNSLLSSLNLRHVIYNGNTDKSFSTCLSPEARMILEKERSESIDYLRTSISTLLSDNDNK